ncbi:hypothetical protein OIE66_09745 [Nonomuraea sp. NBC_01738]|uniref:hypothetical protein n=1 Tax=Nonomuraea sp. NBC_01738 TaxID=2976003 RepID=UPI002E0F8503|nr:hypothetical protein OIE66_09745 [Nonomuraea sp. NBC_01738]
MVYRIAWAAKPGPLDPLFVLENLLFYFGSWDSACKHEDGRAVIAAHLPDGWEPPEGVARVREPTAAEAERRERLGNRVWPD